MASLRHRREEARMADDYEEEGDSTAAESSSSPAPYDLELHSMTAKGIKHLCSELLEINKASEEDFRRNVYLSYLSFLRLLEEAGDLEKDVGHLKRHVIAQRRLIQHLTDNLYSSILVAESSSKEEESVDEKDANDCSPCDALDVLLSEHRMDQALELLELQGQALEKMQNDGHSARLIATSMSALSARKARVADRFASLADNPRTPRHELLKALSGLCKLGDAQRANHLLFKFYRSSAIRRVEELRRCSKELSDGSINYIKELACTVFSSILQASRSFIMLHGHPSSYTSELIRWAREEIEDFSIAFCEYVKSISQVGETSLVLALDVARCALSYCSRLTPLKIVSEEDLIGLIVPCMEEVLAMYAKHLKEVIRLFVASDAWVLGRFLISGILRARSPTSAAAGVQIEPCLLTTSGRKFVTLIQEVVEDVSPLLNLRMENSVLQLLAELFREYMHSIVEVIPRRVGAFQNEARASAPDQQYMWQLSVLINCTTLVSLFPTIAHGIFKSNEAALLSAADFSTQSELDGLILFIKEAAGQVWTYFCQQFIRDTMSSLQTKPTTSSGERIFAACLPSSPQGMMPSFAFQVLFLRVRQLNTLYGTILTGKDGTMKKLLQELMEAMIFWLSNNLDYSWIHQAQNVPKDMLFYQIQLDIHFLLEFARLGGFSSDNIRTTALDLLGKAEEKVSSLEHDMNSSTIREEGWATDAAKHAVQVLMGTELINMSGSQQEASVKNENVLTAGEFDVARNGQEGEETGSQIDDSVTSSGQEDMVDTWSNEHYASSSVEPPMDETVAYGCDGKSTDEFISIEDDRGAAEGSAEGEGDMSSESQILDSENGEDKMKRIPVEARGTDQCGAGDDVQVSEVDGVPLPLPDTLFSGLGGSEVCHAAIEATPCDPQDEAGDHDSSCSFATSPELFQDNTYSTPIPVVNDSADEGTSPVDALYKSVADKMSTSSAEGTDPGSSSSRRRRRRQRQATTRGGRRPAAKDEQGTSSRKKREAMSRSSRPRWQ